METRCSKCGMQNPDGAEWCVECGSQLSGADHNLSSVLISSEAVATETPLPPLDRPSIATSTSSSWWQRLSPDLKASLTFLLGWEALTALTSITAGTSCVASFPFYVAAALGQGIMVGRFASKDSRYSKEDYLKLGLRSGLWSGLITFIVAFVLTAIILGATLMVAVSVLPLAVVSHLGGIALRMIMVTIGSWMYGKYGGRKLTTAVVIAGVLGMVIACMLMVIVSAILATAGISLWKHLG